MINAQQRARLKALGLERLPIIPATDARHSSEPPADTRPRFQSGKLTGRLIDRYDRITEEIDPAGLTALVASGDPDVAEVWEKNKSSIEWWADEHTKREAAAAPARAKEAERAVLAKIGLDPGDADLQTFYEQHGEQIIAMQRAQQARAEAAALEGEAARLTAGVEATLNPKPEVPS